GRRAYARPVADSLSPAAARRVALAAQGFGAPRPASVGTRQLNSVIRRLGLLQLDSVNVLERSHYLPVFARLGAYDKAKLDALTFSRRGPYGEYWAHEAAIVPVEDLPLFGFRMQRFRERSEAGSWYPAHSGTIEWLRSELRDNGPMRASEIERDAQAPRRGGWWEWDDVKRGLEAMFAMGDVVSAGRTRFERTYALPEQVLPAEVRERDVPHDD